MSKEFLKFDDVEIEKWKFHSSKSPISMNYVGIDKIKISDKFSFGWKDLCFICYKNVELGKPLCPMLPKISGYVKSFDKANLRMPFLMEDKQLLKKSNLLMLWKSFWQWSSM